jgi:stage V sporulation protein G
VEITEVRIKLMEETGGERLQAFCSITFDNCFVVRDLKIIEGSNGPFVAMPSRKLTSHCPSCGSKNHLRAAYCNQCGSRLKDDRAIKDADGRAKLYADIAHPINSACREMIQNRVIEDFRQEQELAKQPGYHSRYDDYDFDIDSIPSAKSPPAERPERIQPAASEPRPPHHRTPTPQPETKPEPSGPKPHPPRQSESSKEGTSGEFGAGIL